LGNALRVGILAIGQWPAKNLGYARGVAGLALRVDGWNEYKYLKINFLKSITSTNEGHGLMLPGQCVADRVNARFLAGSPAA
jgi:hypothetical protein